MTLPPLVPLAAAFVAFALVALTVRSSRRRPRAAEPPSSGSNDDGGAPAVGDGEFGVPFTQLGVDVEPPAPPDWPSRTTARHEPHAPLALAHVDRATAILHEHVRREPGSIATWLMLLELYRTHGREQALAELARDFAERFRSPRGEPASAVRGGADGGLEAFPPVMRLVTMLWGTHECRDLLERLSRDRGEGRRLGLSRAAYVDLATLANLLDTLLAEIDADRAEEQKVRAAWRTASYVAQA